MRKTLALVLLALLLLQVGGTYVFFAFRLALNRQEMRARLRLLPDSALTRFEFTEAQWQQAQVEEDEILWDDAMWDIARAERRGASWIVFALRDHDEENLLDWLTRLAEQPEEDGTQPPLHLIKLLSCKFICPRLEIPQNTFRLINTETRYLLPVADFVPAIVAPPPRRIVYNS